MLTPAQSSQLQQCLELAREINQHQEAIAQFTQLRDSIVQDESAKSLIDGIWAEVLAARRSSAFWQQMSDVEKDVSERLAQNHVQLQQNYLRLMQEM
ncbi:hypothetical protein LEP3755_36460 [Leptolyngbya sp. NIES-3755]|nr:hypothetical protein LEP3755_36460 [Leptolyngbya sp. NIES-3755]